MLSVLLDSTQADELAAAGHTAGLQDLFGKTPLHYAATSNNVLSIQLLLAWCPQLQLAKDQAGRTALDIAVYMRQREAIAALGGSASTSLGSMLGDIVGSLVGSSGEGPSGQPTAGNRQRGHDSIGDGGWVSGCSVVLISHT
jgi:ankyrin repeat protein